MRTIFHYYADGEQKDWKMVMKNKAVPEDSRHPVVALTTGRVATRASYASPRMREGTTFSVKMNGAFTKAKAHRRARS